MGKTYRQDSKNKNWRQQKQKRQMRKSPKPFVIPVEQRRYDAINHRVRGRRGAGLVALTSGGAIPDNADYRVVLEPSETFIGTVNEDFCGFDIFLSET